MRSAGFATNAFARQVLERATMNIDPATEKQIREFLLGRLPPPQSEELEQRLLASDELEDLVSLVEDEIIDQYVDGPIKRADRLAVDNHFLLPPARQSKLAFARMLRERLRPPKPIPPGPAYVPLPMLLASASTTWILAGLLSVVSVGSGVYITTLRKERQSLTEQLQIVQREVEANRNQAHSGQLLAQDVRFAVGGFKSASPSEAVEISETTGVIKAHIPLFDGPSLAQSYTVRIQNEEGKQIVSYPAWKPHTKGGGSELIVDIDPKEMPPGTYTAFVTPNRKGASTDKTYCTIR